MKVNNGLSKEELFSSLHTSSVIPACRRSGLRFSIYRLCSSSDFDINEVEPLWI